MSGAAAVSPLPGSLRGNRRLSQWLRFRADGFVEIFSGKVEIGQGILTALAQIAAEELDVSVASVRMIPASTATSPDEAMTSGSLSVQESGTALRHACAEARAIYLSAAAARLGEPLESLIVDEGDIVSATGARTSYWALAADDVLDRDATAQVAAKPASAHRIVGKAIARLDLPDKIFGEPCFIHDLELPQMLHGRVLRPPSPDATLIDIDESQVRTLPGVVAIVTGDDIAAICKPRRRRNLAPSCDPSRPGVVGNVAQSAGRGDQRRRQQIHSGNSSGRADDEDKLFATVPRAWLDRAFVRAGAIR